MIVTASKDHSAKLLDAESLDVLKTFRTERPVNSAALSPIKDHVSVEYSVLTETPLILLDSIGPQSWQSCVQRSRGVH